MEADHVIPNACPCCKSEDAPGAPPGVSWWWPEGKDGTVQCRHCNRFHIVREDTRTNEEMLRDWLEGECNLGAVSLTRVRVYHSIGRGEYKELPPITSKLHEGPIGLPRDIGHVVDYCMAIVNLDSEYRSNKNIYRITTEQDVPVTIERGLTRMVPHKRSKHISLISDGKTAASKGDSK